MNPRRVMAPGPRRHRGARRGSALLELAIILPFLTFLLLAVFDIGRAFAEQEAVTAAAREGARYYAHEPDIAAAQAVVSADLNGIPASPAQISVDMVRMTVTVLVPYTHDLLFGLLYRFGSGGSLALSAAATMPLGVPAEPLTPYPTRTTAPPPTPLPTLTPTATPTRTPTATRTATTTPVAACPSPDDERAWACRINNGGQPYWVVLVGVDNYQNGDTATASLCSGSGPVTCGSPLSLACAAGYCAGQINDPSNSYSYVRFTVTRPSSPCLPAAIQVRVKCQGGNTGDTLLPTSTPLAAAPSTDRGAVPPAPARTAAGAQFILASVRMPDAFAPAIPDCAYDPSGTGAAPVALTPIPCP